MIKNIAFEGGEGCGKSTLSQLLAKRFNYHWTFEPFGEDNEFLSDVNDLCYKLRTFCLNKKYNDIMTDTARELIMLANRSIHQKSLKSQKDLGVISDRSWISGYIYKKVASPNFDPSLWRAILFGVVKPAPIDLVIYVKGTKTIMKEGNNDIYDTAKSYFHKAIDKEFENFFENEIIDFLGGKKCYTFTNDFSMTPEYNVEQLVKELNERKLL